MTLVANPRAHAHEMQFRDTWLRIVARESLDAGLDLLLTLEKDWGRDNVLDGARAVLARLVRADPERASGVVARSTDPWDRLAWLETLSWWFELPAAAEPILRDLLNVGDPDIDIQLARALTSARALPWLDRALTTAEAHPPLERARDLAPGVSQLRAAGLQDEAERVRDRLLRLLPERGGQPGVVAPRDLFDTLSASGLPALVPWGAGPGLP
jgi:hypothetical protein